MEAFKALGRMNLRQWIQQVLNVAMVITSAVMLWKGMGLIANTESPIVVVLSGSMEPAFYRGDILFLHNPDPAPVLPGDVVVFKLKGQDIPIVHRALRVHERGDNGEQYILTKGDNNNVDDRGLYPGNEMWIHPKDIMGRTYGFIPWAGYLTILLNDYPSLKVVMVGILGLVALVTRDDE